MLPTTACLHEFPKFDYKNNCVVRLSFNCLSIRAMCSTLSSAMTKAITKVVIALSLVECGVGGGLKYVIRYAKKSQIQTKLIVKIKVQSKRK